MKAEIISSIDANFAIKAKYMTYPITLSTGKGGVRFYSRRGEIRFWQSYLRWTRQVGAPWDTKDIERLVKTMKG